MPRSILIGLDGSEYSDVATELGIRWAKQYDSKLTGIGIIDVLDAEMRYAEKGASSVARFDGELRKLRHRVDNYLELFRLRCKDAGVSCSVTEDIGKPADEILLEAQRHDLILLGKQTFFTEMADNTLLQIAKHTPRPLVTIPRSLPSGEMAVVAYDGSLQAARALHAFRASGLCNGRVVSVLTVDSEEAEAKRRANYAAEYLSLHGIDAQIHISTEHHHVADSLLADAERLGAGFLVMGAYGKSKLTGFLFGSVTDAVIRAAQIPVFLYH